MQLSFEHHGNRYQCATHDAKSIAIELDFNGPQPNYFGAERAFSSELKLDDFVGDTRKGGVCNVETLQMIPHCNGTHTETIGHIVDQNIGDDAKGEDVWVGRVAINPLMVAILITVTPRLGSQTAEGYRPKLGATDRIIESAQLLEAIARVCDVEKVRPEALIVRTIPNDLEKRSRQYASEDAAPFFTVEAIETINSLKFDHLLVDFPSIDRIKDEGLLTNHHLFWGVPETTHDLVESSFRNKTLTEMIFVDDEIADGLFGLNIQIPAFKSDAAPSRPIVMSLKPA